MSPERGPWATVASRRAPPDDAARGFFESSFDLRSGLEVSEAPLASLPMEIEAELRRLQKSHSS